MTELKKKKGNGKVAWAITSVCLAGLFTAITVLANGLFEPIIQTILGGPMPITDSSIEAIYFSDYDSKAQSKKAGDELNVEIVKEGITLLQNNGALPLEKGSKISVFGKNSVDLVLGGSGSGGIGSDNAKTIFDGLTAGGFEYNKTLKEFYEKDNLSGAGLEERPAPDALSSS